MGPDRPLFSVIIPTRNRSAPFAVALHSVLNQRYPKFEVIVINDGSSEEHELLYRQLVEAARISIWMLSLVSTQGGHGPSYVRNYGARHAHGEYLCFLDDDDQWTDPDHLSRIASVITAEARPIELILAGQQAFRNGVHVPGVKWVNDVAERLGTPPDATGSYVVTPEDLVACQAHCHLNTTIASRTFFFELGGFDEALRYEEDRDFYLRAIDRARRIKFRPEIVSRHNVPDVALKISASSLESETSKRLYQLRVFDKAILFSALPELRRHAMRQRAFTLKHIATEAARFRRFDIATYYAREALMAGFTLSWLGAMTFFTLRQLIPGAKSALDNSISASTDHDCDNARVSVKPIRR
jgi:glycosyltransferase involved in cell wall biosynthesis